MPGPDLTLNWIPEVTVRLGCSLSHVEARTDGLTVHLLRATFGTDHRLGFGTWTGSFMALQTPGNSGLPQAGCGMLLRQRRGCRVSRQQAAGSIYFP